MESFSLAHQPDHPGSLTRTTHSALHNNVNNLVRCTIFGKIAEKTGDFRNGCLRFWQPAAPNLIPGLVQLPANGQNPIAHKSLARTAA
jgi:hypothetical protein